MVDENSETSNRNNQKLHPETVMVSIIGGPELHVDQVDGGIRTADVDHLEFIKTRLICLSTKRLMEQHNMLG